MEAFSVQSLITVTIPSSLSCREATEKPFASHVNLSHFTRYPCTSRATKHKIRCTNAQASDSKDDNLVFVAGATGRVGSRTVSPRIPIVTAGVQNARRAGALVQSVKKLKLDGTSASGGGQAVEKLEIVECDLEKPETIGSALGNASTVICSIGAIINLHCTNVENTKMRNICSLYLAATVAKIWKRKEEATLLASGLPYTVSDRPGNMHEAQHGRPQRKIAELMAVMAKNHDLSYCKIVNRILQLSVFQIPRLMLWLCKSYDDLKPPSSPSPSQPGDGKQTKISETVPKPSALDSPSSVLGVHGISQTTSLSEMEKPLFPYVAYPDLKPPTSSPNASTIPFSTSAGDGVPEIATVSSNGPAQLSIADEPKEEHLPEPKSRSLSPYTT
ncbi:Protein TIC 62, chloroplastic isoform B [Glycine soja]|uniref:Protein TIC 62, chloroplastic isoform B n=1 Tax=Glycine soja TaxID=3848 RepID=A0A445I0Z2_GLYSO|nr:Protein TIC 62, chloroplastic isoform B [Glycine soja]